MKCFKYCSTIFTKCCQNGLWSPATLQNRQAGGLSIGIHYAWSCTLMRYTGSWLADWPAGNKIVGWNGVLSENAPSYRRVDLGSGKRYISLNGHGPSADSWTSESQHFGLWSRKPMYEGGNDGRAFSLNPCRGFYDRCGYARSLSAFKWHLRASRFLNISSFLRRYI